MTSPTIPPSPHEDDLHAFHDGLHAAALLAELAIQDRRDGRAWEATYTSAVERAFEALQAVGVGRKETRPAATGSVAP